MLSSLDFFSQKKVTPWNFVLASGVMERTTNLNGVDNKIIQRVKMYKYTYVHSNQSTTASVIFFSRKMTQKLRYLPLSLPLIFFPVLMFNTVELRVCSFDQKFSRDDFPNDFVFGSGTSAYQVILHFFVSLNCLRYS